MKRRHATHNNGQSHHTPLHHCSTDLANYMPPLLPHPRCTRLSSSSHRYSVHLSNARLNQYSQSVIPFSGALWNSLPASEAHVNTCYKHFYYFITEFDLVPQKEFEPLKDMTAKICHDTPEPAVNSEPKK
ncbi:MOB kinase activator 3A [Portunus trituberculatus]|uniref:MOB kinase activator 3A n=1 Tax=Portunus trituberculatus TaxID=210409 RepID=A0A5B7DD37_PORTR|nr:MOB kinase activator 3A [Portunus trituberculatus]